MNISSANIPIHIARAYGVEQAINVARAPVAAETRATGLATSDQAGGKKLVAGIVPGGIDFSSQKPKASAPGLAMYRHPADRNAVATSIDAGRVIDTTA